MPVSKSRQRKTRKITNNYRPVRNEYGKLVYDIKDVPQDLKNRYRIGKSWKGHLVIESPSMNMGRNGFKPKDTKPEARNYSSSNNVPTAVVNHIWDRIDKDCLKYNGRAFK